MVNVDIEIQVIIRVMPNAEDIDVSLPLSATANDVIESLLEADLGIPKLDNEGKAISYRLTPKGSNQNIGEFQSLGSVQVQTGDILLMTPDVVAGAISPTL